MAQIFELFRATEPALRSWIERRAYPLPFDVSDCVQSAEDLMLIQGAVLGAPRGHDADAEPIFCASSDGPWLWALAGEATRRLASLGQEATAGAAVYVLDYEESDLSPQARSTGASRAERIAFWAATLSDLRPFCAAALERQESIYLFHAL